MNKKDFAVGLILGFVLSMVVSFFLTNYYIDQKVTEAKEEAKKQYDNLKEKLEVEFQEEIASLKAYANKTAVEKGNALVENASDKLKEYWNKSEEVKDSTQSE